jgi:hypothetical protein
MNVNELVLIDKLKGSSGVVEIEEEELRVQMVGLSDLSDQLSEVDLSCWVDVQVGVHPFFFFPQPQPDSYIGELLLVKHYITSLGLLIIIILIQ